MDLTYLSKYILYLSFMGSVVIGIILLTKVIFKDRLNARWHYYIWFLVILRLMIPYTPESSLSIFNFLPQISQQDEVIESLRESQGSEIEYEFKVVNDNQIVYDDSFDDSTYTSNTLPKVNSMIRTEVDNTADSSIHESIIFESKSDFSVNNENSISEEVNNASREIKTPIISSNISSENINGIRKIDPVLQYAVPGTLSKNDTSMNFKYDVFSLIWLFGALSVLSTVLFVNIKFHWKLRKQRKCDDLILNELLAKCKQQLNIKTNIQIVYDENLKTPSIIGVMKPKIVLPKRINDQLSHDELKYVLLHELTHLKRKDILINWITILIQAIYWFNPLVWYAFYKMREDCEVACDASVLSYLEKSEHIEYGKTILSVLTNLSRPNFIPVAVGMANNKSNIKRRIWRIKMFKQTSWKWSIIAVVLAVGIGSVGLTSALGDSNNDDTLDIVTLENGQKVIETRDKNENGRIDHIFIQFTKEIDPNSLSVNNFTVEGFQVEDVHLEKVLKEEKIQQLVAEASEKYDMSSEILEPMLRDQEKGKYQTKFFKEEKFTDADYEAINTNVIVEVMELEDRDGAETPKISINKDTLKDKDGNLFTGLNNEISNDRVAPTVGIRYESLFFEDENPDPYIVEGTLTFEFHNQYVFYDISHYEILLENQDNRAEEAISTVIPDGSTKYAVNIKITEKELIENSLFITDQSEFLRFRLRAIDVGGNISYPNFNSEEIVDFTNDLELTNFAAHDVLLADEPEIAYLSFNFSKQIDLSSLSKDSFSVEGYDVEDVFYNYLIDEDKVEKNIAIVRVKQKSENSSKKPNVSISKSAIKDLYGNLFEGMSNVQVEKIIKSDSYNAILDSQDITTRDQDLNGKIEHIIIRFAKRIDPSTLSKEYFTVEGYNVEDVYYRHEYFNEDLPQNELVWVRVTEQGHPDGLYSPKVSITGDKLKYEDGKYFEGIKGMQATAFVGPRFKDSKLSFTDTNFQKGFIEGTLTFDASPDEHFIDYYLVSFDGEEQTSKLWIDKDKLAKFWAVDVMKDNEVTTPNKYVDAFAEHYVESLFQLNTGLSMEILPDESKTYSIDFKLSGFEEQDFYSFEVTPVSGKVYGPTRTIEIQDYLGG
ncbi:M56 family metallopeptidase [Chengkuizengella axinellae]|uniref:M56 family metallopeptidase n=1 Tax=Chengkuizengella axinellae TaxID=3064388 RepID=A0ABT9J4L5_9BACL|nr:M56 family metallopeptidase [Chengkuizengella sp. 2205SS18-9]MDP5276407.1 M56 family metallopeptidase [Chengkuizengella sp. 2205SS18-9]